MTETATAPNPTDASASDEASATLLASATSGTDETQQTQNAETPTPEADGSEENANQKSGETKPAGAPEKYEFTAPEGTEYDAEILEAFRGAAKAADLTQDAAQKLIDAMSPALAARQVDQMNAIHREWAEASTADKEFGGDKLKASLGTAKKALDAVPAGAALAKLLEETGLGNHPDAIRYLFQVGKAISEETFVGGRPGGGTERPITDILFDKTPKG